MVDTEETHPPRLSLRAFVVCTAAAVLLLVAEGGKLLDIGKLLIGILPVGTQGDGWVHLLLSKAGVSLAILLLALLIGSSSGLAVAVVASTRGKIIRGIFAWLGRFLMDLPLMSLALVTVYLLVQAWKIPIESLFPSRVSADLDTWDLFLTRWIWYAMVPAIVLAIPVFGMSLTYALNAFAEVRPLPLTGHLKTRGIRPRVILFNHLIPLLKSSFGERIRPFMGVALAWAIPVEEIFRIDGLGGFMANGLRAGDSVSLAAGVYLTGIMMAVWYLIPTLLDSRHGVPTQLRHETQHFGIAAWLGVAFILTGILTSLLASSKTAWTLAFKATLHETTTAFSLALFIVLLVFVVGLLACVLHPLMKVRNGGLAATLCAAPIYVCLLSAAALTTNSWIRFALIAGGIALPEIAKHREALRLLYKTKYAEASVILGSSPLSFWWRHGVSVQWPVFGRLFFRSMAHVILWKTLFDFYAQQGNPSASWGMQIHLGMTEVLDDPMASLAPGICAALWCLSFQLLARGFRVSAPSRLEPAKSRSK